MLQRDDIYLWTLSGAEEYALHCSMGELADSGYKPQRISLQVISLDNPIAPLWRAAVFFPRPVSPDMITLRLDAVVGTPGRLALRDILCIGSSIEALRYPGIRRLLNCTRRYGLGATLDSLENAMRIAEHSEGHALGFRLHKSIFEAIGLILGNFLLRPHQVRRLMACFHRPLPTRLLCLQESMRLSPGEEALRSALLESELCYARSKVLRSVLSSE